MTFLSHIPTVSWWERAASWSAPIVMYGTGNGADKILDACEKYGIHVCGVFASDGFVRNREFRGMHVMSYSEVIDKFGEDIVILVAFGTTLPEIIDRVREMASRHTVIIPEVPLYGGCVFDSVLFEKEADAFEKLYDSLSDDMSRRILTDTLKFRMTGDMKYLDCCESVRESYSSIFGECGIVNAIDGGAFRGDSASDMMHALAALRHVTACEPDARNFSKLRELCEDNIGECTVEAVCCALGDTCGQVMYSASGSRGAGQNGRSRRARSENVTYCTVDSLTNERKIDLIKLDVEGDELASLRGASEVILRDRPCLAISLYHKTDDIIEIPRYIDTLLPGCRMYLRRPQCIPMWDLTLYVIPEGR